MELLGLLGAFLLGAGATGVVALHLITQLEAARDHERAAKEAALVERDVADSQVRLLTAQLTLARTRTRKEKH